MGIKINRHDWRNDIDYARRLSQDDRDWLMSFLDEFNQEARHGVLPKDQQLEAKRDTRAQRSDLLNRLRPTDHTQNATQLSIQRCACQRPESKYRRRYGPEDYVGESTSPEDGIIELIDLMKHKKGRVKRRG